MNPMQSPNTGVGRKLNEIGKDSACECAKRREAIKAIRYNLEVLRDEDIDTVLAFVKIRAANRGG